MCDSITDTDINLETEPCIAQTGVKVNTAPSVGSFLAQTGSI